MPLRREIPAAHEHGLGHALAAGIDEMAVHRDAAAQRELDVEWAFVGLGAELAEGVGIGSRVGPVEIAGQLHRRDFLVKVVGRRPFYKEVAGARHDAQAEGAISGGDRILFIRVEPAVAVLDEVGVVPLVGLVMHDRTGHRPARASLDHAATDEHSLRQRRNRHGM